MTEHFARAGDSLSAAVKAYNQTIASLEARVLPATRKLEELGARGAKTLPPVKPIENPPFMNALDPDLLARTCTEAGLTVIDAAFISRADFKGLGRMDGRENAGVIAIRK